MRCGCSARRDAPQARRAAGTTSSANPWISSMKYGAKTMKMKCVTPASTLARNRVETLLLVADHDLAADQLGRRLAHRRHEPAHELFPRRRRAIAEREEDGLLDGVGVAPHGVPVAAQDVDQIPHLLGAGADVPHVGVAGDD